MSSDCMYIIGNATSNHLMQLQETNYISRVLQELVHSLSIVMMFSKPSATS